MRSRKQLCNANTSLIFFHQVVFLVGNGKHLDYYHGIFAQQKSPWCYWVAEVDEKRILAAMQALGSQAPLFQSSCKGEK